MLRILGVLALCATLGLSTGCMNRGMSGTAKQCQPTDDLEVKANFHKTAEIGPAELKGSIYNKSLQNEYDNVQLRVNFIDYKGHEISSQVLVLTKDIDAGEAEEFTLRVVPPEGTQSANWDIVCAEQGGTF